MNYRAYLLSFFVFPVVGFACYLYVYSQQYVQNGTKTATMGIVFKNTLHLEQYRKISTGNGWLGKYDNYSRSDRHDEVLTVYCKEYCEK